MENSTATLIAKSRQDIGCGRVPTAEVLKLCERTEEILSLAIRLEKALHESIKENETFLAIIKKEG